MTTPSILQRPLGNATFFLALAVLTMVFIIAMILLVSETIRSNISAFGVLALVILFFVTLITTLATTEIIPWHGMTLQHLRQPRIVSAIGSLLLVSFGSLYSYLPLLAGKGGVETAIEELSRVLVTIGTDTAATRKTTEAMQKGLVGKGIVAGMPTVIEQRVNGVWGQADCANTYRFMLTPAGSQSRVLTIKSIQSAAGLAPYQGQFAYVVANDQFGGDGFKRSILHTEEIQGNHVGAAVQFFLERSGDTEKLLWHSKNNDQNPLELIRCRK
jgi:hypothetical protein